MIAIGEDQAGQLWLGGSRRAGLFRFDKTSEAFERYRHDAADPYSLSHDKVTDKVRAFEAGGVDYLSHPLQRGEVLARIATHLTLQHLHQQIVIQQRQLATWQERERIGRDLHDNLAQTMGYVNLQVQTALTLLDDQQTPQATALLRQLVPTVQKAQSDIRAYILGMHQSETPLPEDFLTVLQKYTEVLQQRHGLQTQLRILDAIPPHPFAPEVEIQLLRIVQEALTNVAKHAGVDTAWLTLTLDETWAEIVIEDEGRRMKAEG